MWPMFKKELRENWAYAAAAFGVVLLILDCYMEQLGWGLFGGGNLNLLQGRLLGYPLPLMAWETLCVWGSQVIAIKIVYEETWRKTWPLLAQLPASRERVVFGKFLAGLFIYGLIMIPAAMLMVALFAAPGTWPGPFRLGDSWALGIALIGGLCTYPLAFLSAQRPARWYATKWLPLALTVPIWIASAMITGAYVRARGPVFTFDEDVLGAILQLLVVVGLLAASVLAVFGIRAQARTREY